MSDQSPSSNDPMIPGAPGQGSLLRAEDFGPLQLRYRRSAKDSLLAVRDDLRRLWDRRGIRRLAALLALVLAIGLPVWAYFELRTRPAPDYALDDIGDVLDYTLLSDDFNKLPIDQRLALIKNLIARLKSMQSGDSELMAAFAAGITSKGRDQLRHNAEKLAVDLWDSYSEKYHDIPAEKKSEYLDNAFLDFTKLMEDVAGVDNKKTDNERLADARKQAKRDAEGARKNLGPIPDGAGRMMKMMQDRGDKVSNPVQQARMVRFTRDMVHHLRGQDDSKAGGEGGGGGGGDAEPQQSPDGPDGPDASPDQPGDQPQAPDDQKPDDQKKKKDPKKKDDKKKPAKKPVITKPTDKPADKPEDGKPPSEPAPGGG